MKKRVQAVSEKRGEDTIPLRKPCFVCACACANFMHAKIYICMYA